MSGAVKGIGNLESFQPPPRATTREKAAIRRSVRVASSNSSSESRVASLVTTVVKLCVPARYSLMAISTACWAALTAST